MKRKPSPQRRAKLAKRNSLERVIIRPGKKEVTPLFDRIVGILEQARTRVVRTVNSEMVLAYWHIGREIVEYLQLGTRRAAYGDQILEQVSARLVDRLGRGYSVTNLKYFRLFYKTYTDREPVIRHFTSDESPRMPKRLQKGREVRESLSRAANSGGSIQGFSSRLSWTHYRALTKVAHPAERAFYEIESERGNWNVPQLERQIATKLFARLLKSRDKSGVMELAMRGQVLERPIDVIQHPYVLDFLDLPEANQLREQDLETAILDKLQQFLLELGKGFAFIARQKRLSFDEEYFYVDLVFYNYILKCFMLVDLKLGKLSHQDVGQMDTYVRLFDEQCRGQDDNPTIGLILCAERNESIARYSILHGHEQLFAAKYVTYLPSEEELKRELTLERTLLEPT